MIEEENIVNDLGHKDIIILQTCDANLYAPMLDYTSRVNRMYAERHGIDFRKFVGFKRGYHPWHACFNRIVMLQELLQSNYRGWVFYIDADAYVFDLNFDLRKYLNACNKPIIMAPGGLSGEKWDVNDGVFLLNFGDPIARDLATDWYNNFMSTTDAELKDAKNWQDVPSDQPRLHRILKHNEIYREALFLADRQLLNNEKGNFVRQVLRSNASTFEQRVARIRSETEEVLKSIYASSYNGSTWFEAEFTRIIGKFGPNAKSYLEWGVGATTQLMADHIRHYGCDHFVILDNDEVRAKNAQSLLSDINGLQILSADFTGPCESDQDAGLNFPGLPLSLGITFDFIFIDSRRRLECAFIAALISHAETTIVLHDYRRTRYLPIRVLFDVLEDGPEFLVMRPRPDLQPLLLQRLADARVGAST